MSIFFQTNGTREMIAKAKKLQEDARRAMLNAVDEFNRIDGKEMDARTPRDTGELIESRYVEPAHFVGDQVMSSIGWKADHAVFVHEDMEAFHRVGQAKFGESVRNESRPYFAQRVAASMKKELGGK